MRETTLNTHTFFQNNLHFLEKEETLKWKMANTVKIPSSKNISVFLGAVRYSQMVFWKVDMHSTCAYVHVDAGTTAWLYWWDSCEEISGCIILLVFQTYKCRLAHLFPFCTALIQCYERVQRGGVQIKRMWWPVPLSFWLFLALSFMAPNWIENAGFSYNITFLF